MNGQAPEHSLPLLDDPLSGTLCHELRKASAAVMAVMTREFARHGLKPSEASLLRFVGANPGCTQSAIARAFRARPANLVPLIARLERDALVERRPAAGRAIALAPTRAGQDLLREVEASHERLEARIGAALDADRKALVIEALRLMGNAACHGD